MSLDICQFNTIETHHLDFTIQTLRRMPKIANWPSYQNWVFFRMNQSPASSPHRRCASSVRLKSSRLLRTDYQADSISCTISIFYCYPFRFYQCQLLFVCFLALLSISRIGLTNLRLVSERLDHLDDDIPFCSVIQSPQALILEAFLLTFFRPSKILQISYDRTVPTMPLFYPGLLNLLTKAYWFRWSDDLRHKPSNIRLMSSFQISKLCISSLGIQSTFSCPLISFFLEVNLLGFSKAVTWNDLALESVNFEYPLSAPNFRFPVFQSSAKISSAFC